jgi:signal peptidase I
VTSARREWLWEWTKTIVASAAVFVVMRAAVVEAYHVPTGSMRPTILEGERILGTKFHYWLWEPETGDVVVFRTPAAVRRLQSQEADRLVKRVIGKEGDLVQIAGGIVRVNGRTLDEPYVLAPPDYELPAIRVPRDHVFVLGDNRNNSLDGHVWGFLPEKDLLAHAFLRYWPPQRIGVL